MSDTNTCMGIFPFDSEKEKLFDSIIKPLVGSHTGLTYVDARTYYEASDIKMNLIASMIEDAKLIVTDLSVKNVNVFFELGIAYNSKKPMVLICSKKSFEEEWKSRMPFDIKGRELLIFEDENDLKVKMGKFIFDSLYKTKEMTVSWVSQSKENHVKSVSRIEIFNKGPVWSNIGINNNFIVSFNVKIHNLIDAVSIRENRNPDIRLHLSSNPGVSPYILLIFPWELSEMDRDKYECHIDYFMNNPSGAHIRLQQVCVAERNIDKIKEFQVMVTFCWPNLVFESNFFEDKVERLLVPKSDLQAKGYPLHLSQYIGFESLNSRVTIDNIAIKEILV